MVKRILYALGISLLIIQFIRPNKNTATGPFHNDIQKTFPMNTQVSESLQRACYDCHSNNSKYPWYNNIQPVAWWLQHHIDEGKSELNFNEFASYSPKKQDHKLEEIAEAITDEWMPLKSYKLVHSESNLSDEEKKAIIAWVNENRSTLNVSKPEKENHAEEQH
ncbi:MAG: heme-binding domain-containing protein [Bacteroidota bacterium]